MIKYYFQNSDWPVEQGIEVTADHFEDLRKQMFILDGRLYAGRELIDYTDLTDAYSNDGRGASTSWAAYVAGLDSDSFPLDPGDALITGIIYFGPDETIGDVYSGRVEFENKTEMAAHPPITSSGQLDEMWARIPDENYYHDYDVNSQRRVIRFTVDGSVGTGDLREHLLDVLAWRFMPAQTDPNYQQKRIQYQDTEREIIHRKMIEYRWSYITQPKTLGAQYDTEVFSPTAYQYRQTKFQLNKEIGLAGKQYQHGSGEPGSKFDPAVYGFADPPYSQGENQFFWDKKICYAFQNMIERICDDGGWCWPLDSDEGQWWIDNFNANAVEPYMYSGYPEWTAGSYNLGDRVWYDGRLLECGFPTSMEPDQDDWYGSGWIVITYLYGDQLTDPVAMPITDELWGCNGSGFEFCLRVLGRFDWYADASHQFMPYEIMKARYVLENDTSPPPSATELYEMYPSSAVTWRRSWKWTHGRISSTLRDGENYTPNDHDYADHQTLLAYLGSPIVRFYWPGIFTPEMPQFNRSAAEEELLAKHHDGKEITYQMINDMKDVLDLLIYRLGLTATLSRKRRVGQGIQAGGEHPTSVKEAFNTVADRAEVAVELQSWSNISSGTPWAPAYKGILTRAYDVPSATWYWDAGSGYNLEQAAIELSGGWADGRFIASEVRLKSYYIDELIEPDPGTGALVFELPEFTMGLPDGQVVTFQTKHYEYGVTPLTHLLDMVIPPDSWDEDYDGSDAHILQFDFLNGRPEPDPLTASAGNPVSVYCYSWFNMYVAAVSGLGDQQVYFKIDLDNVPKEVFETIHDKVFTEVEIDDGLFNTNGILN